jgi:SAM-dependent methyltransferase
MPTSWSAHVARTAEFYGSLVAEHGDDIRALDYGSRRSQQVRFGVLAEAIPPGATLLDVGCGFSELADFLDERRILVQYQGVDISAELIERARQRHPERSLRVLDILTADPGGPYDVIVANGIFYLLRDDAVVCMRRLIRRMWQLTRRKLAFTSLSAWSPRRAEEEFQAEPLETLDYCRTLTPFVALRHDYLEHDFAIIMRRSPGEPAPTSAGDPQSGARPS